MSAPGDASEPSPSSRPGAIRVRARVGGREVSEGDRLPGRGALAIEVEGLAPGAEVALRVGAREVWLEADNAGRASWSDPRLLAATAGQVTLACEGARLTFEVSPTKLVYEAVLALLDDLENASPGLARDAAGVGSVDLRAASDAVLHELEQLVGRLASAASGVRARPIARERERARPVTASAGLQRSADARFLAQRPHEVARVEGRGPAVGVHRERQRDLDTLENRGVLATLDLVAARLRACAEEVDTERARLRRGRAAREAFRTEFGSLWSERDAPRMLALDALGARVEALQVALRRARSTTGLPNLHPRPAAMSRTAKVVAHPDYWAYFQTGREVEALSGAPPAGLAAVRSLDELWERWCALDLARALLRLRPDARLGFGGGGWFSELEPGPVLEAADLRLLYEPAYAYRDAPIGKLHPGSPWRPDLVLEVRGAAGPAVHVFDAKFMTDPAFPQRPPKEAVREIWWKYGESLGDRDGRPVVRSVWALWPGDGVWTLGPGMLRADWPEVRLRGGAIGRDPRRPGDALDRVLERLIGRDAVT